MSLAHSNHSVDNMFLSMEKNLSSFVNWLNQVMKERKVSPTDIANTGFVSISAVSLLTSMTTKSVSVEMCKAIAKATGVPLIVVYQKAGHLPSGPGTDDWVEEVNEKVKLVPPALRGLVNSVIDSAIRGEEAEQKSKQKTKPAKG